MSERTGVVYRIYHKESMKSYIGQTVNIKQRLNKHFRGDENCRLLNHAIKKYGKHAFLVEILEDNVHEELLDKMEIMSIRFWNCKTPNGYNIADGGGGMRNPWNKGIPRTEEVKKAISQTLRGNIPVNKGVPHSDETRKKMRGAKRDFIPWNKGKTGVYSDEAIQAMSESAKGRRVSLEARGKMSEARKGEKNPNFGKGLPGKKNPMFGRTHSPEARRKISEGRKGKYSGEKNPNFGKTSSPETRAKISEALKGKTHSPEARANMSKGQRRRARERAEQAK